MTLSELGLDTYLQLHPTTIPRNELARVTSENKTDWDIVTAHGISKGITLTTFRQTRDQTEWPKVGDFVHIEPLPGEDRAKIIAVLPRFSIISRTKETGEQILATNINTVFVVYGLDQNLNVSLLQRYAAMGLDGGAKVVIVVNKYDKAKLSGAVIDFIQRALPDLPVITTSAKEGTGLDALQKYIDTGHTVVFVGQSGAGKSSLLNTLMNRDTQITAAVRSDGKGRHTTTRRELFLLPNGGIVIDTPGIRTLEQAASNETTQAIFNEISKIAEDCKFRDCDHNKSAGCKVKAAVENGTINHIQYEQFLKFIRADHYESSKDSRVVQHERRQKHKQQNAALKRFYKNKKS